VAFFSSISYQFDFLLLFWWGKFLHTYSWHVTTEEVNKNIIGLHNEMEQKQKHCMTCHLMGIYKKRDIQQ